MPFQDDLSDDARQVAITSSPERQEKLFLSQSTETFVTKSSLTQSKIPVDNFDDFNFSANQFEATLTEPRDEAKPSTIVRPKDEENKKESRFSSTRWLKGSTTVWYDYNKNNLPKNQSKIDDQDVDNDAATVSPRNVIFNLTHEGNGINIIEIKNSRPPTNIPETPVVKDDVNFKDRPISKNYNYTESKQYQNKSLENITRSTLTRILETVENFTKPANITDQKQKKDMLTQSQPFNQNQTENMTDVDGLVPEIFAERVHTTKFHDSVSQNVSKTLNRTKPLMTVSPRTEVPVNGSNSNISPTTPQKGGSHSLINTTAQKSLLTTEPKHIPVTTKKRVQTTKQDPRTEISDQIGPSYDITSNGLCDSHVDIITPDGPLKFYNITKCWTPRFGKDVGLLIIFFPVGISCLVSLYGLYLLIPGLNKEFIKARPTFKGSRFFCRGLVRILAYIWQVSVVVINVYFLTIFTTLFDVFDVFMDFSMGYKLEIGDVIDSHIYRNVWVINFIFVFAFLGVIKIAICLHILRNKRDKVPLFEAKSQCYCIGFLLEDCGEMFLEYFYIETYLTSAVGITWFLLIRNTIFCFLSVRLLFLHLLELLKRCYSKESESLGGSIYVI